jgi:hypothetical protein
MTNSAFFIFFVVLGLTAPFMVAMLLWRNFAQLEFPNLKQKIGNLYEGLNLTQGRSVIGIPFVFLLRRLLMSMSVIY